MEGLGSTLWQEQPDGKLKPIGIDTKRITQLKN